MPSMPSMPSMRTSLSRHGSHSRLSMSRRDSSTDESCAAVDKMIQAIQKQICAELGFREVYVSTGEEVSEESLQNATLLANNLSMLSVNSGSSSSSSNDAVNLGSIGANSFSNGGIPPSSSMTNLSVYGTSATSTTSAEDLRQVFGDEVWNSFSSSRMGYLYGMRRCPSELSTTGSECNECQKGTVFVSPRYDMKKRLLVIVPYREAGIWSRSICMQQQHAKDETGSMMPYLRKALTEGYGVVIMNPAAQVCHPQRHVERVWDQIIAPLESDVFVIAFSRGSQFVKHILDHDMGQGIVQDRVKALALVEPSHYVQDSDPYFTRRILARRAVAWLLSGEIQVGQKIPKASARHGCVCVSAGTVPMNVMGSSGAWALEMVMSSVFGSFAARCGEAAGVTVNDSRIPNCGICHRKLGLLNRRIPCSWCEVKYCSRCCEDKPVPAFGSSRVCSLCQQLPCLIDPRRKNKIAKKHSSPTASSLAAERCSVFIRPAVASGEDDDVCLGDFEIVKMIGRGACGRVKLVRKKHGQDEGAFYAMKGIRKKMVIQRGLVEATNAERRILDRINHPYIATLCYAFQSEAKLYLLSRYYPGGNLLDQMRLVRRFTEDRSRLYTAEVALAIHHLHQNNIIYRDLKLENVLVGSDGHVALTDFGMSKENIEDGCRTNTFVGTYQMMSPELVSGKPYGRPVDWWALGVMVYEMIDGRTPFNAKTNKLIRERIVNVDVKYSPRFHETVKDFVSKLLTKDEDERLGSGEDGFERIKSHPWFDGLDWDKVAAKEALFEGQADLMKKHAKEYETKDIFETYMQSTEVTVDTPASVKDTEEELFNDFAFNYIDEQELKAAREDTESGTSDPLEEDDDDERRMLEEEETFEMEGIGAPAPAANGVMDGQGELLPHGGGLKRAESQFDIALLRPEKGKDFEFSDGSDSDGSGGKKELVLAPPGPEIPDVAALVAMAEAKLKMTSQREEQLANGHHVEFELHEMQLNDKYATPSQQQYREPEEEMPLA